MNFYAAYAVVSSFDYIYSISSLTIKIARVIHIQRFLKRVYEGRDFLLLS